jgi:hypothetical protein
MRDIARTSIPQWRATVASGTVLIPREDMKVHNVTDQRITCLSEWQESLSPFHLFFPNSHIWFKASNTYTGSSFSPQKWNLIPCIKLIFFSLKITYITLNYSWTMMSSTLISWTWICLSYLVVNISNF